MHGEADAMRGGEEGNCLCRSGTGMKSSCFSRTHKSASEISFKEIERILFISDYIYVQACACVYMCVCAWKELKKLKKGRG